MKAIYYFATFLASLVILAYAGWQVHLHYQMGAFNAPIHKMCHGCSCGCNESGVCKCGQQCPCPCGCGTSGKCECGKKEK